MVTPDLLFFFDGKPAAESELDEELMDWIHEAYEFAVSKRPGK